MSDEAIAVPTVVPTEAAPAWEDDSPSEGQNDPSEASEPQGDTKAKAAPPKAPETKPAAPKPDPMFEIDGRKMTQAEIKRELEKAKGSDSKFREAAEMRKEIEQFMEAFQKDPLSILKDKRIPIDRKSLGEKLLLESLEEEMLTPEQRKLREYEEKLKNYETQEQAAARQAEEAKLEQRKEIARQEIGQLFAKAMEQTPLSKDPETAAMAMRDMAMMMRVAKERGIEVSAEDLAKHAESKHYKGMRALAESLEAPDLIQVLGEGIINKLRKYDLAQLKAKSQQPQTYKDESWDAPKSSGRKPMDPYAAREAARKALFGK